MHKPPHNGLGREGDSTQSPDMIYAELLRLHIESMPDYPALSVIQLTRTTETRAHMTNPRSIDDFHGWIGSAQFYIGYNRYGYIWNHGFVAVCDYHENDKLKEMVEELTAGDSDASDAAEYIQGNAEWLACDPNPAIAMESLVGIVREYYFNDLNG